MSENNKIISLCEKYREYFPIGAAVSAKTVDTHSDTLKKHFNSLTAENETKPFMTHPEENKYTFELGDKISGFAKDNGMLFRGHTLVWHNAMPMWFFNKPGFVPDMEAVKKSIAAGKPPFDINALDKSKFASRELILERMKEHITTVMQHFTHADVWDVVNEAISDEQEGEALRKSLWTELVGEDFIAHAFKWAREARSDTKLYYNDYNECNPVKRQRICDLIKSLNSKEKMVDGFGMQAHWSIFHPEFDAITESIEAYASLGIDIQITELDVSLFRFDDQSGIDAPTPELLSAQAEIYDKIFTIFRKYKKYITNVTLWGVADDSSWLSNFPVKNRKNWPLLFDDNHKEKPAFYKVTEF